MSDRQRLVASCRGPSVRACLLYLLVTAAAAAEASGLIAPARNPEPALGRRLDQPLVTYGRNAVEPCFADYVPTPEEVDALPVVRLATNEYEPLQLGLYVPAGQKTLTNVTLDVRCDLPHKAGFLYYEPNARRRVLDHGRVYDHRRPSMPLYVILGNTITELRPGRSGAFWVTFGTRDGVTPGVHQASIAITAAGIEPMRREVRIQVRPFALPRPRAAFGCYYRIDRVPVYYGRKYQEMYVRDQAEHGHNCAQIISYFSAFGLDSFQDDGKVPTPAWIVKWRDLFRPNDFERGVIDPTQFLAAQMDLFREAGLTHRDIPVFGVQDNPTGPRKPFVTDTLRRLCIENDWPEILLYMRDEPPAWIGDGFSKEFVDDITEYKRLERGRGVAAMGGESTIAWGHLHDVWIVLGGFPTPEMVREASRQNAEVWTYLHDLRITNAVANRYYAGLYTWGLGVDGNVPYAYHHGEVGQPHPVYLPQEKRPSREQILGFILPSPDGPIPGVGWEGRREGIDDYRYLQLLEARVAAAPTESPVRVAAERWLAQLKRQMERAALRGVLLDFVTVWDLDWMDPDPEVAPEHYGTIREVAAEFIAELPPAPGEAHPTPASHEPPRSGLEGAEFLTRTLAECREALQSGTTAEMRSAACAIALRPTEDLASFPSDALVALLENGDVRVPALRALRAMGSAAVGAIPAIQAQLRDRDPFVRLHGLFALDAMGPPGIGAIAGLLSDTFPGVVGVAAHALERKGEAARSVLLALEGALHSSNPRVRGRVLAAIRAIRGE